jgi:hypothetical protein
MRIIGCDLHKAKQTIAMLHRDTGKVVERTLSHDVETVREFYVAIPKPAVVGIEATGSMGWFVRLMEELGVTCRVGHPAAVRTAEPRRQKHDRRDAQLLLRLLLEDRFPAIWLPNGGAAGSASPAPPPASMGAHANALATGAAGDGARAGRASRRHAVEDRRPSRPRSVAAPAARHRSTRRTAELFFRHSAVSRASSPH